MRFTQSPPVLWALLGSLLAACGSTSSTAPAAASATPEPAAEAPAPFVSVERFAQLQADGATVLDARGAAAFETAHLQGAASAPWPQFVDAPQSGVLSADTATLQAKLRTLGVSNDRPVLVYGAWDDEWGEEGRLFWMLEYLGHRDVSVLAGGLQAWQAAGKPVTAEAGAPTSGTFTVAVRSELRTTADELLQAIEQDRVVVLDNRHAMEFMGATPYGSARGGHVPQAVNFHWKEVFDSNGQLLPVGTLRERFTGLGVGEDTLVVTYCTGGVRSGFVYTVMRAAGYTQAKNYDGSWWEWSQRTELPAE